MSTTYLLFGITVMALTTYAIRCIPMVAFRNKINNLWVRSFLYYVPYAVLSAMTFPAVLNSTSNVPSAVVATVVAVALAYFKKGLLTVALGSSLAAFLVLWLG